eukprot:gene18522-18804_t
MRNFGLLWFDAHMDAHTPETSESQSPHGMPLAVLLGKGIYEWVNLGKVVPKLYPENLALLGIRSYEKGEAQLLERNHVKIFYQSDVEKIGLDVAYQEAHAHVTRTTPYFGVSIDVDVFDPSIAPGEGAWLWDIKGRKYLDMMSAYSAVSHGHCHPRILKVLTQQAGQLTMCSRAYYNDKLGGFLEALCTFVGMEMSLPMNSGVEAVETALKASRRWGYQHKKIPENQAEIIVTANNFHGRTLGVISFSTEEDYRSGFGPFLPGFKVVPFGDAKALASSITLNTCAVLTEPIQGEADEIQSGLGRTGKVLACDHEDVKPDAVVLGKALGGGYLPISAVVGSKELLSVFDYGSHGSTFGGNPLAAVVGLEAIKVLEEEGLIERSAELGDYFLKALRQIKSPFVKEGLEDRLSSLALRTHRSKSFYVKEALEKYLEDEEEHQIALEAYEDYLKSGKKTYSFEEVMNENGLTDDKDR